MSEELFGEQGQASEPRRNLRGGAYQAERDFQPVLDAESVDAYLQLMSQYESADWSGQDDYHTNLLTENQKKQIDDGAKGYLIWIYIGLIFIILTACVKGYKYRQQKKRLQKTSYI